MIKTIEDARFALECGILDLKNAWGRAKSGYEIAIDTRGYPFSLKEVWNSQAGLVCAMLRNSVEGLVEDFPQIPAPYIRGLISTPMTFQYLAGKTPYKALLDDPCITMLDNAKIAIRREVYDLNDLLRDNPSIVLERTFFSPQLKK